MLRSDPHPAVPNTIPTTNIARRQRDRQPGRRSGRQPGMRLPSTRVRVRRGRLMTEERTACSRRVPSIEFEANRSLDQAMTSIIRPIPSTVVVGTGSHACAPRHEPEAFSEWSTGRTSPIRASVASFAASPPAPEATGRGGYTDDRSSTRSRMFCRRRYSGNRLGCWNTPSARRRGEAYKPTGWIPTSLTPCAVRAACQRSDLSPRPKRTRSMRPRALSKRGTDGTGRGHNAACCPRATHERCVDSPRACR